MINSSWEYFSVSGKMCMSKTGYMYLEMFADKFRLPGVEVVGGMPEAVGGRQ